MALEPAKPRPNVRGGSREALSGFAEALARAQDPATASVAADFDELPGAQETADAVAAYRRETEIDADETHLEQRTSTSQRRSPRSRQSCRQTCRR